MHRSPAYENRLGFFNMQECSSLGAYLDVARIQVKGDHNISPRHLTM